MFHTVLTISHILYILSQLFQIFIEAIWCSHWIKYSSFYQISWKFILTYSIIVNCEFEGFLAALHSVSLHCLSCWIEEVNWMSHISNMINTSVSSGQHQCWYPSDTILTQTNRPIHYLEWGTEDIPVEQLFYSQTFASFIPLKCENLMLFFVIHRVANVMHFP